LEEDMPVRKVSNRGGNVIGRFPSLKMQRMIAFESLIERDYLYLLDYEREIEWFEEQPLTIEYLHNGKTLHYTPDFRFVVAEQNTLVECKPYALVNQEDNLRKFAAACSWCTNQGWQFRVVTDQDLRTGFRLENIKLLTRHARHTVEPEIKGRICALLYAASALTPIDTVVKDIEWSIPNAVIAGILHMAFHHELFIPLNDGPISKCMPIGLCPPSHDEVKP
jgi:hypothetical protein